MNEVLSLEEIKRRYETGWVLLENPQHDEYGRVSGGKLIIHSRDRNEVYGKGVELRPRHAAYLFIGEMPEDVIFAL